LVQNLTEKLIKKLDDFVLKSGLKRSDVRNKILEVIVKKARHFTIADLIPVLQKRYPDVGRATLYRTLPIFVSSGILQEGPQDPLGQTYYELAEGEHHDHIVCLDCREIFEFHDDQIEKRQLAVASSMRFSVENHGHVVYARCQDLSR
jgi:Fur family ferric uptake transcriptional regulator